jgi:hypothetical protein
MDLPRGRYNSYTAENIIALMLNFKFAKRIS